MEFLTVVVSVRNKCQRPSCVACEICIWLCETFGDFGKRERVPGESLESIGNELERKWAGWQKRCIGPY